MGESTLKLLLSLGLEFLPTADTKYFKGIGAVLVQSVSAGHFRCRVQVGGDDIRIKVHVVEGDRPLLLLLATQSRLGVILNLVGRTLLVGGRQTPLQSCSRGDHVLILLPPSSSTLLGDVYAVNTLDLSEEQWGDAS